MTIQLLADAITELVGGLTDLPGDCRDELKRRLLTLLDDQNGLLDAAVKSAHFTHKYWLAIEAAGDECEDGTYDVESLNSLNIMRFSEKSKQLSATVVELTEQLAGGP